MKRFPFPIRYSVPAILLIFGGLLGAVSFEQEVTRSHFRTEQDASEQAEFTGQQTSSILEYLYRTSDRGSEGANLVISQLGANPNLNKAILLDESDRVLLSTRYEWRDRPLASLPDIKILMALDSIRQHQAGTVVLSSDRQHLQAVYPVQLKGDPGDVVSSRTGILLLEYDLTALKHRAFLDALQRSLINSSILAILCGFIWLFFYKTLTQRVSRLVAASDSLASGDLTVRTQLNGSDELARVSAAFDHMAERLQADTTERLRSQQELQEWAQREKLLNHLASQIRNSLQLDQILSTTVHEVRTLLNVDRCNFLWWLDRPTLTYQLTHEARHPDLPSVIGEYANTEPESTYLTRLKQGKTIQIDDLASDTQLEAGIRQLFLNRGYQSLLACPVLTRSGKLGIIVCLHCAKTQAWEANEVNLLQAVATQLAIALEQAELYEHSQQAATEAQAKAEALEAALTDLQQAQTQLIQTEKMSSLGQLVAGVAHEINNPVNFIHGNLTYVNEYTQNLFDLVNLYQQHYPKPVSAVNTYAEDIDLEFLKVDLPKTLSSMRVGTDRIRQIVLSLRNFSRIDEADMKPVDIHEGLDSTLLILQNRLKASSDSSEIHIIKEYGNLPKVECYASQLNQVFMNILCNAIDVLEDRDRERSSQELEENPSTITIRTECLDSESVVVRIRDNGLGMPESIQQKLFDPFFTTKPTGKGTGLGLSISQQIIVEKHHGHIHCESILGMGTEFWIEIPVCQVVPVPQ